MTRILITGGRAFLGRNLVTHLSASRDFTTWVFDRTNSLEDLRNWASEADLIFHLAGVNRTNDKVKFETDNVGLTEHLCQFLKELRRSPKIVFSSSVQAILLWVL